MAALFGGDSLRVPLTRILVAVGDFRRRDAGKDEARTEAPGELRQQPGAQARHEMLILEAGFRQLVAPQLRVVALRLRQLQEEVLAQRISLRRGKSGVKS